MSLGKHFDIPEFCRSTSADRLGLDNEPTEEHVDAMMFLVGHGLDPFRSRLGQAVRVTSGFRSVHLNRAVGGSSTSQHLRGEAADIVVNGLSSEDIARRWLAWLLPFDQIIGYAGKPHLHVSLSRSRERRQVLWTPVSGPPVRWGVAGE